MIMPLIRQFVLNTVAADGSRAGRRTNLGPRNHAVVFDVIAKQVIIGEDGSRKIYLIYKEPIADTTETEFESSDNRESVLSTMKEDDFRALLKKTASEISVKKSSACDKYKPSMFES